MGSLYPQIPVPGITGTKTVTYGKELAFDFAAGEFIMEDGRPKVVEGVDALKVWIEKAIRTARYRFPIYSFRYGCELEEIIGKDIPRAVLESEIRRVIREALIYDNRISDVRDFKFDRGGDWLKVEFTVITFDNNAFRQGVSVVV
ncbi:MAG: DUF2634 domain-containing protein [Desulfotomaculales bacterium]